MAINILKNRFTPLVFAIANDHVISFLVDVKVSNDIIDLKWRECSHPGGRKSLSLFLLLEALEVIQYV